MIKNKKKILLLLITILFIIGNQSFAARKKFNNTIYPEIRTDFLSLGFSSYQLNYSAENPNASFSGLMQEYYFKAQVRISYMLLSILYETGQNDQKTVSSILGVKEPIYSGKLPTGETINSPINTIYKRLEYNMGFSYSSSSRFHFVLPYTGLGYQTLLLDQHITNPNVLVNYRYEWFYIPIGFKLQYQIFKNCVAGLDTSYRLLLGVRSSIYTSKIYAATDPDVSDTVFKMTRGFSFRSEIPFDFYLNDWFGITISPWLEYISFNNQSSAVATGLSNHTITNSVNKISTYGITLSLNIYLY